MNRFLTFPLIATLFVFAAVLYSHQSTGEQLQTTLTSATSNYSHHAAPDLLTAKQAETLVLDQWPIRETVILSRVMPRTTLEANLHMAEHTTDDHSFLGTLLVHAAASPEKLQMDFTKLQSDKLTLNNPTKHFPIHVDRYAKTARIFVDRQWLPYDQWRDENLPKYKELTGWGK